MAMVMLRSVVRKKYGPRCGPKGGFEVAMMWAFSDGSGFVLQRLRSGSKNTIRRCVKMTIYGHTSLGVTCDTL